MINKEKFKLLHAIRGFAALIVVIAHAKFPFWSGGKEYIAKFPRSDWGVFDYLTFAIDMFTSNATVMVIIFFVLSGFFIAYSFNANNWNIGQFYTNRAIRIYTPYLGSILLTLVLFKLAMLINPDLFLSTNPRQYNQDIITASQDFNIKTLLWSFIFVGNPQYIGYNYPYWSLFIEMLFYLIAPFFVKKPKTFLFSSLILITTGFLFEHYIRPFFFYGPIYNFLFIYSIYFALGYFTYWLIFTYKIQEKIKRINVWYFNFGAIITLFIAMYSGFFVTHTYTYLLGGLFTVIMIYRLIVYPTKISFFNKFFISMGKISYTMYLIHIPLFIFMYSILVKLTGQEVFYSRIYWIPVIIVVLFSYFYYWLVEHQSLKLIKWYKSKIFEKKTNSQ